ncbi:RDD family protein [Methylolobus aquaticus]
MTTHYDTLRVRSDAPAELIALAYWTLRKRYDLSRFPDKKEAVLRIINELNTAYAILSDPERRKDYDALCLSARNKSPSKISGASESFKIDSYVDRAHDPFSINNQDSLDAIESSTSSHPWRRFFARQLDYFFLGAAFSLIIIVLGPLGIFSQRLTILLSIPLVAAPVVCLFGMLIEGNILARFGTTPGKRLLGLRLERLTGSTDYSARARAVWVKGIGMGLPFIWIIPAAVAYYSLKRYGRTSWDNALGFRLEAANLGTQQIALVTVLICLCILMRACSYSESVTQIRNMYLTTTDLEGVNYNGHVRRLYADPDASDKYQMASPNKASTSLQNIAVPTAAIDQQAAPYRDLPISTKSQEISSSRIAALTGDTAAQVRLGQIYETGDGVSQDYAEAAYWYLRAAEQGNILAQNAIGWIYLNGLGVKQDTSVGINWLTTAASQGDARAQNNLGWMYLNAHRVAQDYAQAIHWFRLAARQGEANAQSNLGVIYEEGRGVKKNTSEAKRWYQLAAAQGHPRAKSRLRALMEEKP